jgi:hypothetical protein
MRNYIHVIKNLPGILARLERELQGKASTSAVTALSARMVTRPTHADLSQAKIDLGVRLDALEAIIEKTGLADLATTLDQIAADQPEPGLRESIRETIAKATANVEAAKVTKARASRKPKGGQ